MILIIVVNYIAFVSDIIVGIDDLICVLHVVNIFMLSSYIFNDDYVGRLVLNSSAVESPDSFFVLCFVSSCSVFCCDDDDAMMMAMTIV